MERGEYLKKQVERLAQALLWGDSFDVARKNLEKDIGCSVTVQLTRKQVLFTVVEAGITYNYLLAFKVYHADIDLDGKVVVKDDASTL